ncbi:hypothetical protein HYZ97_05045 [Candidatus Pacearchaeota archaeon]|nr:hypothetical protein [Candidatus Pacearchaeota archaeon]
MHSKRGLSDVVTTVLIILLVVAAVASIWVFIQPTLKSAGSGIQRGQVCLTSSVEPLSCKLSNATTSTYNVAYRRTTDNALVKNVSSMKITLELSDGTVITKDGDINLANGASNSTAFGAGNKSVKQVSIVTEYLLNDGPKQTCTSPPLTCDNTASS